MGCFTVSKRKKKYMEELGRMKQMSGFQMVAASTVLTEPPHVSGRSLQSAPPSFKNRISSVGIRTLSAPSSFKNAEQDYIRYEETRSPPGSHPLPLPSNQRPARTGIPKFGKANSFSGSLPLPPLRSLQQFTYEDIATACQNFSETLSSTIFNASFPETKLEATVTCLLRSTSLGMKDLVNEVNMLGSLQHPNLCKLLGFYGGDGSEKKRMLVYERLIHGSLDRLLHGRSESPSLDWNGRMKIALCAARGLAFLHEEGPFEAMYSEFSSANIQIDRDFTAKLSGYGCVNQRTNAVLSGHPAAAASLSVETVERGLLTPKSNVWSFGVVLLGLLTGRRNFDPRHPAEERSLVKWSRPILSDNSRLSLIMDPHLQGRFPAAAVRAVADLARRCIQIDPADRPTMRTVVEQLVVVVRDLRYRCFFPLQEPRRPDRPFTGLNRKNLPDFRSHSRPSVSPAGPRPISPPACSVQPPPCGIRKSQSTSLRRDRIELKAF